MTRAIDGLVNVDFADRAMPDWMTRVKDDYFKGGFDFTSPELEQLLEDMDAHGVEKAILTTQVGQTAADSRAIRFAEARPDRFALGVGGFNLLQPMTTVRALGPSSPTTPLPTRRWRPASGATACTRPPTASTTRCTSSAASSNYRCA